MRIKTFYCQSTEEAFEQIRQELGDDAVIISTLDEGKRVRVTAACEKLPSEGAAAPETPEKKPTKTIVDQVKARMCKMITYHSLPQQVGDAMIEQMYAMPRSVLNMGAEEVIARLMRFNALNFDAVKPTNLRMMVVGPLGAGKSVTLAKLASELLIASHKPIILSCDQRKAGAEAQVIRFASAMEVPYHFCDSPQALRDKLLEIKKEAPDGHPPVLIDTPGVNPYLDKDIDLLAECVIASQTAPVAVIPAGLDAHETMDQARVFKDLGCTRIIASRVDTARRYGSILSVIFQEHLELCAISSGPEIAQRLIPGTPKHFTATCMKHIPQEAPEKRLKPSFEGVTPPVQKPSARGENVTPFKRKKPANPVTSHAPAAGAEFPMWVKKVMESNT